ncbi:hypothetical protein Tco_0746013, partial [Tanacetum coccineum]
MGMETGMRMRLRNRDGGGKYDLRNSQTRAIPTLTVKFVFKLRITRESNEMDNIDSKNWKVVRLKMLRKRMQFSVNTETKQI